MFRRRVTIKRVTASGATEFCPVKWIDDFAMRNFTNDGLFDDTLPAGDGLLEVVNRVPVERLASAMEDWFRRKGYIVGTERLHIQEA